MCCVQAIFLKTSLHLYTFTIFHNYVILPVFLATEGIAVQASDTIWQYILFQQAAKKADNTLKIVDFL